MADPQIVSCPGCGKRYSVPAGTPPGQFQCQDCSSVVAYGQGAGHGHAHGKGGGPHPGGAGAAKRAARSAAAHRKIQGRRAVEEEDDDRGRRGPERHHGEQQNPMLYLAGFLVLALLVGGFVYLSRVGKSDSDATGKGGKEKASHKGPGAKAEETLSEGIGAATPAPASGDTGRPGTARPLAPPPSAGDSGGGMKVEPRARKEEDRYERAANPPTGGNYGKTDAALQAMLKADRASVMTDLGHLPDTPDAAKASIDADAAKIADPNLGREFLTAQDRLIKAGRAAIPRALSAASKLDFSRFKDALEGRDACYVADAVDNVLREITGYDKLTRLQYTPQAKMETYQATIEGWYRWWLSVGHLRARFETRKGEGDE